MCSWSITERTAERSAPMRTAPLRRNLGRRGSVTFSRTFWVMTRPRARRSSGSITTPRRIAPCGRRRGRTTPSRSSSPDVIGSAPAIMRASSVRPLPTRPARPTISPARTRRSTSLGTCPHSARASSTTGASAATGGAAGKLTSSWRPSMPSTSESLVSAAAGAVRVMRPSRMIVTVSATASTSSRKWLTYTRVRPCERRSRISCCRRCDSSRDSDEVGSSSTIRRALRARARMISTFCWSARRSDDTGTSPGRPKPTRSSSSR